MILSDAILRLALGANLLPDSGDISGAFHVGREIDLPLPDATSVWAARITFSATGQTAVIKPHSASIVPTGAVVTRLGGGDGTPGDGLDIYGQALPHITTLRACAMFCVSGTVAADALLRSLSAGNFFVIGGDGLAYTSDATVITLSVTAAAVIDVIFVGE